MAELLEQVAKTFLNDKAWSVEIVLLTGAELAQAVNKMAGLTGEEKANLVCQTILKMLDNAMMVEKGREMESTEKEKSIALLEECKRTVLTLLPVTLTLLVAASRGKILLKKAKQEGCFSAFLQCMSDLSSVKNVSSCVAGIAAGAAVVSFAAGAKAKAKAQEVKVPPSDSTENQPVDEKQVQLEQAPQEEVQHTQKSDLPLSDENKS